MCAAKPPGGSNCRSDAEGSAEKHGGRSSSRESALVQQRVALIEAVIAERRGHTGVPAFDPRLVEDRPIAAVRATGRAPLRILLVLCCPKHVHHLRLQEEERAIRQAIARGRYRERIVLEVLPAATIDDLSHALLEQEYDLIHFSGHSDPALNAVALLKSAFRGLHGDDAFEALCVHVEALAALDAAAVRLLQDLEIVLVEELRNATSLDALHSAGFVEVNLPDLMAAAEPQEDGGYPLVARFSPQELLDAGVGSLAFETESGHCCFVRPHDFAELLRAHSPPVRCAVLNACGSSLQGLLASCAVPLAVGMGNRISDAEASQWSAGFYAALASGHSINDAYSEGCRRIGLHALDRYQLHRQPHGALPQHRREGARVHLFRNRQLDGGGGAHLSERSSRPGEVPSAAIVADEALSWVRNPLLGPLVGLRFIALEEGSSAVMLAASDAEKASSSSSSSASAVAVSEALQRENESLQRLLNYGVTVLKQKDAALERQDSALQQKDDTIRRLEAQIAAAQLCSRNRASNGLNTRALLEAAPGWEVQRRRRGDGRGENGARAATRTTSSSTTDSGRTSPALSSGAGSKKKRVVVQVKQTKSSLLARRFVLKALGKNAVAEAPSIIGGVGVASAAGSFLSSSDSGSHHWELKRSGAASAALEAALKEDGEAPQPAAAVPQTASSQYALVMRQAPLPPEAAPSPPRKDEAAAARPASAGSGCSAKHSPTKATHGNDQQQQHDNRPLRRLANAFGGAAHGFGPPGPPAAAALPSVAMPSGGLPSGPTYQFSSRTPRFPNAERPAPFHGAPVRRQYPPPPPPPPPHPQPPFQRMPLGGPGTSNGSGSPGSTSSGFRSLAFRPGAGAVAGFTWHRAGPTQPTGDPPGAAAA